MRETQDIKQNYRTELEKNGAIAFVPGGNSMWPTLKNRGQTVIVERKTEKLKAFDVALYQRKDGTNVLHRVMKPTDAGYIICGDSQFTLEPVEEDAVYGVMTGFYRGDRFISVTDENYIREVEKLYSDEKLRKRRVKRFYFFNNLRSLPGRALRKIFGKKKKEGKDGV